MILLMAASAISGFLLGRFFGVYVLIPAVLVLVAPSWYLGAEQGFGTGMLAFVLSAVVMQVCYWASLMTRVIIDNVSVIDNVPSEAAPSPPKLRSQLSSY